MARPTIRDVEVAVCGRFNLTAEQIRGDDRARRVARPRQIAMFLAREKTGLSFPTIGGHFGLHHSTVIAGARRIKAMIGTHPKVAAYVEQCRDAIPDVSARDAAKRSAMLFWAQRLREGVASWPADGPPPVCMIPPPMPETAPELVS